MGRMKIMLISGVSMIGLATAAWGISSAATASDGWRTQKAGWGGHHGHGRHRGGMAAKFCSGDMSHLEDAIAFAQVRLGITDEQKPTFNALAETVRSEGENLRKHCEDFREMREASAPTKLEKAEAVMTTGLAALKNFRAAFDPFYAALNDDQKKTLEDFMNRHRRGHKRGWHDDDDDDRDDRG